MLKLYQKISGLMSCSS